MIRLKDRSRPGPGGFQFFQSETGFELKKACPECVWSFANAVKAIIKNRRGNPRFNLSLDPGTVSAELDLYNALRYSKIPGADVYIEDAANVPTGDSLPKSLRPHSGVGVVAGALGKLPGAMTIKEMFGENGVVDAPTAEARADICMTCKYNQTGNWTRWFTLPITNQLRQLLEWTGGKNLVTSKDAQLHICELCACPLRLKLWARLDHIHKHMPLPVWQDVAANAPWCWMNEKTPRLD